MLKVGYDQFPLVEYLAGQLMLSDEDRFQALREYFPQAKKSDWRLWQAGQRVQIIKRDAEKGGVLKLGTEIVASKDGSIAGLLGASPGASTAAPIMLSCWRRFSRRRSRARTGRRRSAASSRATARSSTTIRSAPSNPSP